MFCSAPREYTSTTDGSPLIAIHFSNPRMNPTTTKISKMTVDRAAKVSTVRIGRRIRFRTPYSHGSSRAWNMLLDLSNNSANHRAAVCTGQKMPGRDLPSDRGRRDYNRKDWKRMRTVEPEGVQLGGRCIQSSDFGETIIAETGRTASRYATVSSSKSKCPSSFPSTAPWQKQLGQACSPAGFESSLEGVEDCDVWEAQQEHLGWSSACAVTDPSNASMQFIGHANVSTVKSKRK